MRPPHKVAVRQPLREVRRVRGERREALGEPAVLAEGLVARQAVGDDAGLHVPSSEQRWRGHDQRVAEGVALDQRVGVQRVRHHDERRAARALRQGVPPRSVRASLVHVLDLVATRPRKLPQPSIEAPDPSVPSGLALAAEAPGALLWNGSRGGPRHGRCPNSRPRHGDKQRKVPKVLRVEIIVGEDGSPAAARPCRQASKKVPLHGNARHVVVEAMRESNGDWNSQTVEKRALPARKLAQHQIDRPLKVCRKRVHHGRVGPARVHRVHARPKVLYATGLVSKSAAVGDVDERRERGLAERAPSGRRKLAVGIERNDVKADVEVALQVCPCLRERCCVPVEDQDAQARRHERPTTRSLLVHARSTLP